MFGNVSAERTALEAAYEDTMDVMRPEKYTDGHKITKTRFQTVAHGIKCGLSYNANVGSVGDTHQNIERDVVIFAPPDINVIAGDTLSVSRFGTLPAVSYTVVGRPRLYATHIEIDVYVTFSGTAITASAATALSDGTVIAKDKAVAWVTGATAGAEVNQSLTNTAYDGAVDADTKYTQAQLETAGFLNEQ